MKAKILFLALLVAVFFALLGSFKAEAATNQTDFSGTPVSVTGSDNFSGSTRGFYDGSWTAVVPAVFPTIPASGVIDVSDTRACVYLRGDSTGSATVGVQLWRASATTTSATSRTAQKVVSFTSGVSQWVCMDSWSGTDLNFDAVPNGYVFGIGISKDAGSASFSVHMSSASSTPLTSMGFIKFGSPNVLQAGTPTFTIDTVTVSDASSTDTRIISVVPVDGSTVATSSIPFNVGASGYVNSEDFSDDLYLRTTIRYRAISAAVSPALATGASDIVVEQLISSSGSFNLSQQLSPAYELPLGDYTVVTTIVRKRVFLGFTYWTSTLATENSLFTLGAKSGLDSYYDSAISYLEDVSDVAAGDCSIDFPFTFTDIRTCLIAFFQTAAEPIATGAVAVADDFIHRAPWGYATRVIDIWNNETATSTLASLSLSLPDNLPVSGTIDFTPWSSIASSVASLEAFENPADPESNMLDSFLFYWDTLWYILFALWSLREFYQVFHTADFHRNRNRQNQ